ncbi:DNA-binding MarR family transcriptional regulator [Paenibacillus cellulosilyticus]|uniref:DNA-binding MarR family transcriptional regulator n=1 Tax=Paenibacillus cellulosilyticus TaxID=375489 RepID=A0A2V2YSV7_9BACL|nr:MarR family transcriptional regulator [Paenibacillus cellulosilyticus]PWW02422.1 DNA-binding MarR family transcriptional regulator [Paenibacillus cellulosilyticus]QKS47133.1 MarR family transcriptional regulator [Paenibacillus cellulosilyticus]
MSTDRQIQSTEQQEILTLRMRSLGARTVLYQQSVATALGLNNNDFLTIDILNEKGPVTAGELAKLTGLTTGSVTALIDRLEKNGFVQRQPDPQDRRKVIIVPLYENKEDVSSIYLQLHAEIVKLASSYSDEELALITQFLGQASSVLEDQIHHLHSNARNKS